MNKRDVTNLGKGDVVHLLNFFSEGILLTNTTAPLGALVPKNPSASHLRVLSASIVAPAGSIARNPCSARHNATSHLRTKSR